MSKCPLPLTLEYSLSEVARKTDVIFSRSSGERRYGREASEDAPRSLHACLRSSEEREKMTPVWKAMSEAVWGQNYHR